MVASDPWQAFAERVARAFDMLAEAAAAACRAIASALEPLRRTLASIHAWRIEHRSEIRRARRWLARVCGAPGWRRCVPVPEAVAWLAVAAGQR